MKKDISILFVANSYGQDTVQYMPQIAKELGINLTVVNMYIGGCEVWRHIDNLQNDKPAYDYEYFDKEADCWKVIPNYRLKDAISERKWDYVSVQQASHESWTPNGLSRVDELIDLITGYLVSKETEFIWHMTWSYPYFSEIPFFVKEFNQKQVDMYKAVAANVEKNIATNKRIKKIIPNGTAVQNLKQYLSDHVIYRDVLHMSLDVGRYLAALDAIKVVADADIDNVNYCPFESIEARQLCKKCVDAAVLKPFEVTTR